MALRILICSATVGAGHGRAACALQTALTRLRPNAFVRHVDVLSLSNPLFRQAYGRWYFDLIDAAPHIVRYMYDWLDRPTVGSFRGSDQLRTVLARVNLGRFVDLLTKEPWDLVISTHFLAPEIVASLRRAGRISCPQAVVTTDFDTHRLWIHSPCDRYFTATEEGRANLAGAGVPVDRVIAAGIPIDPVFSVAKSVANCRSRHGIAGEHPVILQLSGGGGFGPAEKVHRALLKTPVPLEIIAVCGRNQTLRDRLNAIPCPSHHRRIVLGFTDQMDELMAAADVVVSKPGGLTTSESLARGVAMLIIEPIPGQEERNSDYLLENGAAIKVNNLASLPHKLSHLVSHPHKLQSLRDAATKLALPFAAIDIAKSALTLIEPQVPVARPAAMPRISRLSRFRFRRHRERPTATVGAT